MKICLYLDGGEGGGEGGCGEGKKLNVVLRRSIVKLTKRGLSPIVVSNPNYFHFKSRAKWL